MKILLLSCSTGEGHNSAAKAVCEALKNAGAECEMKDPVSFRSEKTPKKIANLYNNLIKKTPKAFGMVYKIGDMVDRSPIPSPIYAWNAQYADKLADYIERSGFDAVVTSHLYGMLALTEAKRLGRLTVPAFGIATDYTMIPFTRDAVLTEIFVPHKDLAPVFVAAGMDEKSVIPTGIPVSPSILTAPEKSEARAALGLPEGKKIVLVMSGGVGCVSVVNPLLKKVKKTHDTDKCWVVLVGNNLKLKEKIEKSCPDGEVIAVGFTDKVRLYLKAADVVISKSGGLSSTEVAAAGVPLVHFKPIPGCESCNAKFFSEKGMSVLAKTGNEALDLAEKLLESEEKRNAMVAAQKKEINASAADDIAGRIRKWVSEK